MTEHEFGGHLENEYQQRDIITGSIIININV